MLYENRKVFSNDKINICNTLVDLQTFKFTAFLGKSEPIHIFENVYICSIAPVRHIFCTHKTHKRVLLPKPIMLIIFLTNASKEKNQFLGKKSFIIEIALKRAN